MNFQPGFAPPFSASAGVIWKPEKAFTFYSFSLS